MSARDAVLDTLVGDVKAVRCPCSSHDGGCGHVARRLERSAERYSWACICCVEHGCWGTSLRESHPDELNCDGMLL